MLFRRLSGVTLLAIVQAFLLSNSIYDVLRLETNANAQEVEATGCWSGPSPFGSWGSLTSKVDEPLQLIVMDPLAGPLACDCVQGYAQRKYEALAAYMTEKLQRPVEVAWSESLATAMKEKTDGKADIIIGKESVVRIEAERQKLKVQPLASLTDKEGSTTQQGYFVVRRESSAASLLDLENHTILFGPDTCDEKWTAPKLTLEEWEVSVAANSRACDACSVAAKELMAMEPNAKAAAVISSYAAPLLEGCGNIKKGDLRIVGKTEPVPFVTVFVNSAVPEATIQAIQQVLFEAKSSELLTAIESKEGFVPYDFSKDSSPSVAEGRSPE